MTVIVTGSETAMGTAILRRLMDKGIAVHPILSGDCHLLHSRPLSHARLLIHAARFACLQTCAEAPQASHAMLGAMEQVTQWGLDTESPVLALSSCLILKSQPPERLTSRSPVAPLTPLAQSLADCERHLMTRHPQSIVLRLGWRLTSNRDGWLHRILTTLSAHEPVPAPEDSRCSPVCEDDVARVVTAMTQQILCGAQCWDVYHYGGVEDVSVRELVRHIQETAHIEGTLNFVQNTENSPRLPAWSHTSSKKLRDDFGIQARPWRRDLGAQVERVLRRLNAQT